MNDHITGDQFSAYIDNELPDIRKQAIQEHIAVCGACAREMESFQEVKIRYGRLPQRSAPPALLARLRAQRAPRPSWIEQLGASLFPRTVWRAAAVCATLSVVSTIVFIGRPGRDEFVDLDSLLVAHSKYQGESLVPHPDMSQSSYSGRLAAFFRDDN